MTNNCPTCFSEKSQDNFMKLGFCGHSFCKECWTEYIDAEISHFNILKLKCHEHCCSYILSPPAPQETLDVQTFWKVSGSPFEKAGQ